LALAIALTAGVTLMRRIEADEHGVSVRAPSYLLIDAATERTIDARWDDRERSLPVGSLIKPFTALAYADTHGFVYPTFTCRGSGRAVGAVIGAALVKTGTAPCTHSPRATADGYAIVIYPADRPRVVLLMQAHGRTGADTAASAGELLMSALGVH